MPGPTVTGPIRRKNPNDVYGVIYTNEAKGTQKNVLTVAQMHAIPVEVREAGMICSVRNSSGSPALYWLNSPDNSVANLSNNNYWELLPLNTSFPTGLTFKGNFSATTKLNSDGVIIQDSPLSPATALNGWFYVCTEAGTANFGSGNQTFNVADWVVYDGSIWRLLVQVSALQWNLITGIPSVIQDIGDGTIVVATETNIDNLQSQINALSALIPTVVSDITGAAGSSVANITALLLAFYTQEQIDDLIAGVGGGQGITKWDNLTSGAVIFADFYYGYDNKVWICTTEHTKGTEFDYSKFEYQNAVDLKHQTFTTVAGQAATRYPVFTIAGANPGEINRLQALAIRGDNKNTDPNYSGKIWTISTVNVANDTITLDLGTDSGYYLVVGDEVEIQYYSDEAQVTGRAYSIPVHEDKGLAPLAVSSDGGDTGISPTYVPIGNAGGIAIFDARVDGTGRFYVPSYGNTNGEVYWSDDGGTTALNAGDDVTPGVTKLYYNPSICTIIGNLTTSHLISLFYSKASLEGNFTLGGSVIARVADGLNDNDNEVPTSKNIRDNIIDFLNNEGLIITSS